MWERFTERSKHVVSAAREEAMRMGSQQVEVEHLLLGVCRDPASVAVRALVNLGVDIESLVTRIEQQVSFRDTLVSGELMEFTSNTKNVLTVAVEEARISGNHNIGTQDILSALLSDGEGAATSVLHDMNVDRKRFRAEVDRLLNIPE